MAEILDERYDETLVDGEQFATIEDIGTEQVEPEQEVVEAQPQQEDEDLPEKYRGKSAKEIARMHQEAEKMIGKHSSEVGELRQYVDSFIKTQLTAKQAPVQSEPVVDDVDFYVDPKKAVEKAVESHPAIQTAKQLAEQTAKQQALQAIAAKHPDMTDIVRNQEFLNWVGASPVRKSLFVAANNNYDLYAADELLSTWKERSGVVQSTKDTMKADQQQQLRAASTGSAKSSGEPSPKKIYRRADIIKLMQTDPDRYEALSGEIFKAYQEGRVK